MKTTARLSHSKFPTMVKGATFGPTVADGFAKLSGRWEGKLSVFVAGLKVKSEANRSRMEHPMSIARRVKQQHEAVEAQLAGRPVPPRSEQLRVTFTREYSGRGQAHDCDNLASSLKAVRDSVAQWLGRDDDDAAGVEWICLQQRTNTPGIGILIETVRAGK